MKRLRSICWSVMDVSTVMLLLLICVLVADPPVVRAITSSESISVDESGVDGGRGGGGGGLANASADDDAGSVASESFTYGSRLAETPFQAFGNPMFQNTLLRDLQRDTQKEESAIYSSGINAILNSDGFLNQMEKYNGGDPKYTPHGPVEMAVHSKKTVEVIPVKFEEPKDGEPQVIEISPYEVPVSIVFKTQTNKLHVNQEHKTEAAEEVKEIQSEEEPQRVVHNIYRPVIQEVTEVVQPYRKVLQKVEPVIEEMKTIIAKSGPPPAEAATGGLMQSRHPQLSYGDSSGRGANVGRFSTADFSLSGYGSEVVKKIAPPPQQTTTSSSLSGPLLLTSTARSQIADTSSSSSSVGDKPSPLEGSIAHVSKLEPLLADKDSNYNDIIKQYIGNLLAAKQHVQHHHHRQQQQQQQQPLSSQRTSASNNAKHINGNSIKILNIPLRNLPSAHARNNHDFTKKSTAKQQEQPLNNELVSDSNKKFKIIKEFRISLSDIKKELAKRSGSGGGGGRGSSFSMIRPFVESSSASPMMVAASSPSVSFQRHHHQPPSRHMAEQRTSAMAAPSRNYHYMKLRQEWSNDRPPAAHFTTGQTMLINLASGNAERRESQTSTSIFEHYQPRNGFRPTVLRRRF